MTCKAFAPVNGIAISHVQNLIPSNHDWWKHMANVALQRLHQLMDPAEVIGWVADNVFDSDSWRTVYDKEYALIEQLEAEK